MPIRGRWINVIAAAAVAHSAHVAAGCAKKPAVVAVEGRMETTVKHGTGYLSRQDFLVAGGVAYELQFAALSTLEGFERSTTSKSVQPISDGTVYGAAGVVSDLQGTYRDMPVKRMEVKHFRVVKAGTGKAVVNFVE